MRVETYSNIYSLDVERLIRKFHEEYLKDYYGSPDQSTIQTTINSFNGENSHNAFLLLYTDQFGNDNCVGLLAGTEITNHLNKERFFQEIIWYVEKPFGRYGIYLVKEAKIILKSEGFSNMIMSVIENAKAVKIKRIYERMKFKALETHYVVSL